MKYDLLQKSPLFKGMTKSDFSDSLELLKAKTQTFKKGETIVSAGRVIKSFGIVVSGTVQVGFSDIDGNEVIFASVTEGETFGEALCWLDVGEMPLSITAFTDCEILFVYPDSLRKADISPLANELKSRYLSILAKKTLLMNERIQILTKPTVRQKITTFLSQCSSRYGGKTFAIPFDRETLALYLGVNRSALSRELSLMQKEGIIEFYKNTFKILV